MCLGESVRGDDCDGNADGEGEDEGGPDGDEDKLQRQIRNRCGCPRSCLGIIPSASITEHALNIQEMEKDVREMYCHGRFK